MERIISPKDLSPSNQPMIAEGLEALDLVTGLPLLLKPPEKKKIIGFGFKTYSPTPPVEERIRGSADSSALKILQEAEELRRKWPMFAGAGLPFWESVSVAAALEGGNISLLREAVVHVANGEKFDVPIEMLSRQTLERNLRGLPDDTLMALYSACLLSDGSSAHIPMIDFRGDPSPQHLTRIKEGLKAIGQTAGVILRSGRSYHFYGFSLLEAQDWLKFMGSALLLAPLTDARYIAHRLIEGLGALRITSCPAKPTIPKVVGLL
ncbi:MAG: primase 1D-like protein [Pyrinomonadaceae bacterium]